MAAGRFSAHQYPETTQKRDRGNSKGAAAAGIHTYRANDARDMGHANTAEWAAGRVDCASFRTCPACAWRRCTTGFRSRAQFAGSRRVDGSAGGPVSTGSERGALQRSADGRRSGANAARRDNAERTLPLSGLGAALAGNVAALSRTLSTDASGNFVAGMAQGCRTRASARSARAASGGVEPCGRCGSRVYPHSVTGTVTPPVGNCYGGRGAGGIAYASSGSKFPVAHLRPRAVDSGGVIVEPVSTAARGRLPPEFCLRGSRRGSWIQRAGVPRGPAYEGWEDESISRRHRFAGGKSRDSCLAHANRWTL